MIHRALSAVKFWLKKNYQMPPRLPTLSTSLVCHYYSKDFTELPMPQCDKGQCNLYSMSEHVHDIVRCLVIACGEACGLLSMTLRLSAAARQSAVRPQSVGAGAVVCCENPLRQQPPSSVTFLSLSFTLCHILWKFRLSDDSRLLLFEKLDGQLLGQQPNAMLSHLVKSFH